MNKGTNNGQRSLADTVEVLRNTEGNRKGVGTWKG